MGTFHISKGRNIRLKGAAVKEVIDLSIPKKIAIQPPDFKGIKPRTVVKEGDRVKAGTPVVTDKRYADLNIVSPVSGKVVKINRGEKRILLDVVIEPDQSQEKESFKSFSSAEIIRLSREEAVKQLMEGGMWPSIRQRPFSKFADFKTKPKSIFVHAMSTEPLAADVDFILENNGEHFQDGLNVLKKLTDGQVHLCFDVLAKSQALIEAEGVEAHLFSGAHPAGNVSTHIHYIDPVKKGDIVWYVEAQDVIRIARLFLEGAYCAQRVVAVTGEGATNRKYIKTVVGASVSDLVGGGTLDNVRCISGSVLGGRDVGKAGFLGYYDSQITILPEGGKRELLGWLSPGVNKYTFSNTYLSAFLGSKEVSLGTDENGSHRAIVLNNVYDSLNALDILTYFLLKAVISQDIEESEKLGILECDQEDFALCTFACPSKTDVGGIIAEGLELIEKEG